MSVKSWGELAVGTATSLRFSISPRDMDRFADLSGDRNRIHADPAFAQKAGLRDRVVYGGLLVAQVSRFLGMELPGEGWIWHNLSLQFHSPLFPNEEAELSGEVVYASEELGVLQIKIEIRRAGQRIASGQVQTGRLK